jgi:hypothetical protein
MFPNSFPHGDTEALRQPGNPDAWHPSVSLCLRGELPRQKIAFQELVH